MISSNLLKTTDVLCEQCKGTCWKGKDNAATQAAALQKFGVIPNKCVNPEQGKALCPYA